MKTRTLFALPAMVVVLGAAPAVAAPGLATSEFVSGADGWAAINGSGHLEWFADGGVSGGYVAGRDTRSDVLWFFDAPAAYEGNQAKAYGGLLTYWLKTGSTHPSLAVSYADVQLLGRNGTLLVYASGLLPADSWTSYSVLFAANGAWRVGSLSGPAATETEIIDVLSDVRQLRIRGDYRQGVETTGLDSVRLVAAPVPEPESAALTLVGMMGVAAAARRTWGRSGR